VYFADCLSQAGFSVLNEVCFNQVLVTSGDPQQTKELLKLIQASGECWCGGASWHGDDVIRISVCSYRTTRQDIDQSVRAFVAARLVL
jgi:threonine aldolase